MTMVCQHAGRLSARSEWTRFCQAVHPAGRVQSRLNREVNCAQAGPNKDVELISRLIICTPMDDLPFQIAETAHALRKSFDRRASALGVTRAQWKVLLRLTRMPGLRQVELADMLDVEPITLSRIVDRLEEGGHVERTPDPADRRVWRLQVTEQAKPLVARLQAVGHDLVEQAFEGIEAEELEQVRDVLARVRENVSAIQRGRKAAEA